MPEMCELVLHYGLSANPNAFEHRNTPLYLLSSTAGEACNAEMASSVHVPDQLVIPLGVKVQRNCAQNILCAANEYLTTEFRSLGFYHYDITRTLIYLEPEQDRFHEWFADFCLRLIRSNIEHQPGRPIPGHKMKAMVLATAYDMAPLWTHASDVLRTQTAHVLGRTFFGRVRKAEFGKGQLHLLRD